jgi:hypothetical protein
LKLLSPADMMKGTPVLSRSHLNEISSKISFLSASYVLETLISYFA